ncbi:MAG: protein kinase, partial [Catenulispora sp.]|nr:protein kinase [Catenulispora sp.]
EPALADFGVAVVPDSATLVTMFRAFTPHHAAPEVLAGADATTQSDVYSLGSTLYHLLTGRPPFDDGDDDGAQLSALMFRIVNTPAPPLDCPELPELAGIVMRALAKNPAERPESAAAMAAELGLLVGGGMRLSGTSLTMPPLNSADPTHRAQPEGAGPVVGGMPGAVIGEVPGAVIGGVSRTAMAAGPGPHGTVEDLGPEEVTVQGTGAQGGFDASDGVADTSGPVYAPTAQQPPVFPSTAPDPPRSAAGFEAPPQDDPVEVPRPATFGPGFTPDPSDQRGTDRRRRPRIIGASAAAAVVVAIGAIALSRGSSSSPSSGNGARTGAAMGAGGGDGSGQSTDASSRPSGQDLAAGGGPMPSAPGSASSSTSGSGANRPGNAPSGSAGSATHPPTSAPGGAAQPSTTQPSASSAPSTSAPKPSTTTKPPSTSSSSKNMSCTGWHITHVVADDGSGYAASGTFNMRSGPYAACSAVGKFTTGQHMYIWCHVTNGYGNVWVYGRIDGTNTPAWESLDNFKSGATLGPAC